MKKSLVFAGLLTLLFLGSCASNATGFAESLPDDEIAVINWRGMHIIEYNGIAVKWNISVMGGLLIKIPGGDTRFILHGQVGSYNMGYTTYNNIPFSYKFENGKEYSVLVSGRWITVYSGNSFSSKNRIVSFDMTDGRQKVSE
jgi:hypothetical protein